MNTGHTDRIVLYLHGAGGNAEEAAHYRPLFEGCDVIGLDYASQTPWEAREEFPALFDAACRGYRSVELIANSIGAFYAMHALTDRDIEKAYFISPVVDMERLISDRMARSGVTEEELCRRQIIRTGCGEPLSWEYLRYVREHPVVWRVPTHILYGEKDNLTSYETISDFAARIGAALTVMDGGEHWFHTEGQMNFLDAWLKVGIGEDPD